jgi:hypothetical protein
VPWANIQFQKAKMLKLRFTEHPLVRISEGMACREYNLAVELLFNKVCQG